MLHGWINQWRWRGDYEGGFSLGLWFSLLCWESFTELGLVGSSRPSWCEHTGRCPPLPPPVRQGWLPLVCIYQDNMTLFLWLLWSCLSFWLGWEMLGNFTHTHLSFFFFPKYPFIKTKTFHKTLCTGFHQKTSLSSRGRMSGQTRGQQICQPASCDFIWHVSNSGVLWHTCLILFPVLCFKPG